MSLDMNELCQNNILSYSSAVNESRAIPDARTGLKPIHQKILYEMWADKILSNKKYRKCAYMVGQIISRFSEHGDAATYDALIRLSQQWIHPYPLIDIHGNNGSQFGDPQAAMRYVEGRLMPIAEKGYLETLGKNPVDWKMNFTNEEKEPETLPAIFPGLFCLENQGLGYACSCQFLTYNLQEIANVLIKYIETDQFDDSIAFDLASGGIIINADEMRKIHSSGKGKIVVESKATFEDNNRIVFTEIPLGVMFDDLLEEIAAMCEEKEYTNIKTIYNDSGNGKLRLVIECKSSAVREDVLEFLYQNTRLRNSYAVNQVALVDKKPMLLSTKDMCRIYKEHNLSCIKREYQFDLNKTLDRIEILEGLERAYNGIDNVIKLIRSSNSSQDAKDYMVNRLNLTERQADAILSLKLSRLAHLEKQEILNELQVKRELSQKLRQLVESEEEQKRVLVQRLSQLANEFGTPRRTQLTNKVIEKKSAVKEKQPPHGVIICLDKNGYVKSVPVAKFHTSPSNIREEKINNNELVCFYSSLGRAFRVKASVFKEGLNSDKGTALGSILQLEPQEKIVDFSTPRCDTTVTLVTSDGYMKRVQCQDINGATQNLRGMSIIKVHDNAEVILVSCSKDYNGVVMMSTKRQLTVRLNDIEVLTKLSPGRKGFKIAKQDTVIFAQMINLANESEFQAIGTTGKSIKDK